jgi:hypothetical protein
LADEDERSLPTVLHRDEGACRADPPGHVIIAAGVGDERRLSVLTFLLRAAGIGEAGLFLDR